MIALAAGLALAGCAPPDLDPSPLRLPTRAACPPTPAPPDARDHYEEGLARRGEGDIEGALESFTLAVALDPDFAPAHVARGFNHLAQGEPDLALAAADDALEADPGNGLAYALRGEVLRLMGRPIESAQAYERAVELELSLKAETFGSRWLAARAIGDANRMLALGREYGAAYPDDPLRHYYLGWAVVELGNARAAIHILRDGIEGAASGVPALVWFALGQAYTAGGFWAEAVTSFETARALVEAGDASLSAHSDLYVGDLFVALGRAYLGVGRCEYAATVLEYAGGVGAPAAVVDPLLEAARVCGTPAP